MVATQLRDESWYSSCEVLRLNSVPTWKIHKIIRDRRRKAWFYRSHAVDTKADINRKNPWGIHTSAGLLEQYLGNLNQFYSILMQLFCFRLNVSNHKNLLQKLLESRLTPWEFLAKLKKKMHKERMEIQLKLSYKGSIFIMYFQYIYIF